MKARRHLAHAVRGAILIGVASVLGCTIQQTVTPVEKEIVVSSSEVCIVENPDVRPGFLEEYRKVLTERGYTIRLLPADAAVGECPLASTYIARWSWDLTIYMSYVRIVVYHDGEQAGEAYYDSTKGSARMDKFVDAEPKIRELVEQLFPVKSAVS